MLAATTDNQLPDGLTVCGGTDVGKHRRRNEDAFLILDLNTGEVDSGAELHTHHMGLHGTLLVVSDGVGSAAAGDVASQMVTMTLRDMLMDLPDDLPAEMRVRFAIDAANERIWRRAQADPQMRGMAATATAVLVQGNTATIAQVGDSRAYLLRDGRLRQLTKDQSWAQMLVDVGAIKPEEMPSARQNVILQALGAASTIKAELTTAELRADDYLLVCSDGLWVKVGADEMRRVIRQSLNPAAACHRLIELANEYGGGDNITVIIAHLDEATHYGAALTITREPATSEYRTLTHAAAA